jgi:hypothetical protein
MRPAPQGLRAPRHLLWVEGKDDSAVVQSLCAQHEFPQVFRVKQKAGIGEIFRGLPVELRATALERFGVVIDADDDAPARWDAVRDTLLRVGYTDAPARLDPEGVIVGGAGKLPRFGAWIMPDNEAPGVLETFAASLVPPDDVLWTHADAVLDEIPDEHRRFREVERPKAHIHTWLAWQEGPGSPMGQAITKGDLDANAPAARRFVAWLRRLFVD